MDITKKPAIRFKGFSDEWKQHPMNELTTELHEYATLDSSYPLLTSSREGIMFQNEYRSNRTTESSRTLFSIVPYGICTYRHMSDDDIFHFNINDIVENGLVSREYPVFDSTDGNDLRFIVTLLNSSARFRKFCRERKIGGTRTRLYYKDLSNFKPLCPEFDEQQSIAEFLDGITSIISQHQSKLEKLQALKISMLEKMFPKDATEVPEVRFKGFTEAWDKYELGKLCVKFTDGDWIESKDQSNSGIRLIQTGNIGIAEYLDKPKSKKWISNETFERLHCEEVFPGDILISRLPEPAGRACIVPDIGVRMITAVDCTIVRTNSGVSNKFLVQYLSSQRYFDKVNAVLAGGTRQRISRSNLSSLSILIPKDFKEQEAIGNYFTYLNTVITLQQQKLDKLQSIKKALLEKMFV